MTCPMCKNKTKVIDKVNNPECNEVYRKHKCSNCGNIFYTYECIEEYDGAFKRQWLNHHRDVKRRKERINRRKEI